MSFNFDHEVAKEYGRPTQPLDATKNPLLISILDAVETLKLMSGQGKLPANVIRNSKGLLFLRISKVGFGISVTQGYGLVIGAMPGSPNGWSAPVPIKLDGFSVGAVVGYSEQHTVIALAVDSDLQAFTQDKRAVKIGIDFGLNLGDKVDKSAALNTQTGQTSEETGSRTQVFTMSKGMMVDISMQGTSVEPDMEDLVSAYGPHVTPADILTGRVSAPRETTLLYNQLKALV